jgi:hypothetical protein
MERPLNRESRIAAITSSTSSAMGVGTACWRMAAEEAGSCFSGSSHRPRARCRRWADHQQAPVALGLALAVLVPEPEEGKAIEPHFTLLDRWGGVG